jgi:hypothetical protein
MPFWKLNFMPFGLVQVPIWVLAEDQALERPVTAPRPAALIAAPLPGSLPENVESAPPPRANGFKRFVHRFVDGLVRLGDRSYEAKVRSGRLNRYYY